MFPPQTRILVVDDSEAVRDQIKRELGALGFKDISVAETAQQALTVLRGKLEAGQAIELLLSDWNMPGTSGLEFLKVIRTMPEYKGLPFIMLTSESDPAQVLDAASAGVSSYIVKPLTGQLLQQKLGSVWSRLKSKS